MKDVTQPEESTLKRGRPKGGTMASYDGRLARRTSTDEYRGKDSPEAQRQAELKAKHVGRQLKLMPCKPFRKGARSRRLRKHTWVRI